MDHEGKQQSVACPNCSWAATTDEQGPRGGAWLKAALEAHLLRDHPAVTLRGRDVAFVGERAART